MDSESKQREWRKLSLTKTVSVEVVENAVTSMGKVALENKNLATDSAIINNAAMKFAGNSGEYTDYLSMDITKTKGYILDNTVYKGEAIFQATMRATVGYGTGSVGITDGSNIVRMTMSNGCKQKMLLE